MAFSEKATKTCARLAAASPCRQSRNANARRRHAGAGQGPARISQPLNASRPTKPRAVVGLRAVAAARLPHEHASPTKLHLRPLADVIEWDISSPAQDMALGFRRQRWPIRSRNGYFA